MRTVAIYTRVSTVSQSCSNQEEELREIAARSGWEITAVYSDHAISGAKGRRDRPGLDQMLKDGIRKKFTTVMVSAIDRLGRSMPDLLNTLGELHAAGIDLYLKREAIDSASPVGRAQFQLLALFSEFERSLIRERVMAGLHRARAEGRKLGRPRMPEAKRQAIRASLEAREGSLRQIATLHRVGLGTVQRLASMRTGAGIADALSDQSQTV